MRYNWVKGNQEGVSDGGSQGIGMRYGIMENGNEDTYCTLHDLLGYHRLNDVGTVETVHAIEPKHSFLSAQWLTSLLGVKPEAVSTHVI